MCVKTPIDAQTSLLRSHGLKLMTLDKEALKTAMEAEGMPKAAINTWLKKYGVEGAAASWRLAVEHADRKTETHGRGTQRKKYIKACMERNIAEINEDEAALKAEIDEREKRVAEEKKRAANEMQDGFAKIGFTIDRKGSDLQSSGSLLGVDEEQIESQELTDSQLQTLVAIMAESGTNSEIFKSTIRNYGYADAGAFFKNI